MPQFSHLYSSGLDYELGSADSTRLFTTARRQNSINEGLQEFADLTECFTRQSTVTCSNAVGEYNLISTVMMPGGDFSRLAKQRPEYRLVSSGSSGSTRHVSGEAFERRDVEWLNQYEPHWRQSTGADLPRFYYERMDGGRRLIGLYPPPTIGTSESGFLTVPYVARPQVMTSDTDVPFAIASTAVGPSTGIRQDLTPYHQAAIHYAAHKLEKLRKNEVQSQRQLQLFLSYVQRWLFAMKPKGGQTIKHARSYFAEITKRRRDVGGPIDATVQRWF